MYVFPYIYIIYNIIYNIYTYTGVPIRDCNAYRYNKHVIYIIYIYIYIYIMYTSISLRKLAADCTQAVSYMHVRGSLSTGGPSLCISQYVYIISIYM